MQRKSKLLEIIKLGRKTVLPWLLHLTFPATSGSHLAALIWLRASLGRPSQRWKLVIPELISLLTATDSTYMWYLCFTQFSSSSILFPLYSILFFLYFFLLFCSLTSSLQNVHKILRCLYPLNCEIFFQ